MSEQPSFQGTRILVAEDDPINREFLEMLLDQLGCDVDCAADGSEAVEKARAGQYDVVLMDMMMPVMDGLDATKAIRSAGITTLPIVALTASDAADDRERCLASGMNDFLTKPIDPARLSEVISACAGRPRPDPQETPADRRSVLAELNVTSEFYDELVRDFGHHTGILLRELEEAARTGRPAEVSAIAHTVKGSAACLRLNEIHRLAAALEAAGKAAADPSAIDQGIAKLKASFELFADPVHQRR